mgnify:CR=1 FL=1
MVCSYIAYVQAGAWVYVDDAEGIEFFEIISNYQIISCIAEYSLQETINITMIKITISILQYIGIEYYYCQDDFYDELINLSYDKG